MLQYVFSVTLFANKLIVLLGNEKWKRIGWWLGAFGAIVGVKYFRDIHLDIYVVLDAGLIVLMGYAAIAKMAKNPNIDLAIRMVAVIVMSALAFYTFDGRMTIAQLISSLGLLWGTYFLPRGWNRLGWSLYVVGHVLGVYIGYHKSGQEFFALLQVLSAVVSVAGIVNFPFRMR